MEKIILESRQDLAKTFAGVGIEVGVAYGTFSDYILFHSKCTRLYSIDPWSMEHPGFPSTEEADRAYHTTMSLLAKYGDRSHVVRIDSNVFVEAMAPDFFDFVYIDADHTFEGTIQQLEDWWDKLKLGGRLCGHDFKNCSEVQSAVRAFAHIKGLQIGLTREDHCAEVETNSFILQKPTEPI